MKTVASYVLGVWDAAVRAPIKPTQGRPWLPRRGWRRWVLGAVSVVLGVGLAGGSIAELVALLKVPSVVAAFLGLSLSLPVAVALVRPLLAWRIQVVSMLCTPLAVMFGPREGVVWPWPITACVAMLVTLGPVGASHPRRIWVGVGILTSAAVFGLGWIAGMPFWIGDILAATAFLALLFGDATGGRRSVQARLDEQRALRRQDLARQAVLEERGRIARELHDVVAHHMTMIAIQAEAAPLKVPDVPPAAAEIFAAINRAAREALTETRTVVGLLRSDDEAAERAPAPGLELLDDLVERARSAGLTVASTVVGVPRPLSAAVDVSAYRILQEALSNASRYAPGSAVRVEVRYTAAAVHLAVTNSAVDATQRAAAPSGAVSTTVGGPAPAGDPKAPAGRSVDGSAGGSVEGSVEGSVGGSVGGGSAGGGPIGGGLAGGGSVGGGLAGGGSVGGLAGGGLVAGGSVGGGSVGRGLDVSDSVGDGPGRSRGDSRADARAAAARNGAVGGRGSAARNGATGGRGSAAERAAAEAAERAKLGGGHGLVGIRERAAMLGGQMTAGPHPAGGWSVTAVLPTAD
ncbi:histidine kinase [Cryptosporangium sp. NPDC051539]|uniref:histidine kinase n=1 Tax=Cryptosporangium sp. NPDC051539 TaxID=3363962 RepID=UPI0037BCDFDE